MSPWNIFCHTPFTVVWLATVVSDVGTWMYNAASGWLMTSLDSDALSVSLGQVASCLPMFLFALPAGAGGHRRQASLSDRHGSCGHVGSRGERSARLARPHQSGSSALVYVPPWCGQRLPRQPGNRWCPALRRGRIWLRRWRATALASTSAAGRRPQRAFGHFRAAGFVQRIVLAGQTYVARSPFGGIVGLCSHRLPARRAKLPNRVERYHRFPLPTQLSSRCTASTSGSRSCPSR